MEFVGTAVVIGIVVVLMLLGIGMVTNQLLRLRKFLKEPPPDTAIGDSPDSPGPPSPD